VVRGFKGYMEANLSLGSEAEAWVKFVRVGGGGTRNELKGKW